ncbi:tyrosine-type recombinase/integrase [Comamonas sp.]|uniref:tyrosine-type recombinase/integrase n=1 Tax=Comamonas sp. TaxID=34028 RepID=UPI002FCB70C8
MMNPKEKQQSTASPPSPPSPPPDATAVFVHWQQAEWGREVDTAQSAYAQLPATGYALVWNAWVLQLQGQTPASSRKPRGARTAPKAWHAATAEDVAHFLQIRPGQRAHHQPGRQISEITRRRYWRLLDRIYAHALEQGWVTYNPVQAVHPVERPAPEQPTGHVLPPALWKALPRHFPDSDDLQGARDRAVLRLLYDMALAPEEVRLLTLGSLRNAHQATMAADDKPSFIQIEGTRAAQHRCLALPATTQAALSAWLAFRHNSGTPAQQAAPLFESRKGGPLTIRALFHIASKTIALARQASPDGALPLARMGPQVLRNTAIVHWLHAGAAPSEVVRRIGVEDVRALAHLQQCVDALQAIRLS